MPAAVPLVTVVRSGVRESVHLGHVAVCDARGRLVAATGDPSVLTFARSSMKPLQAAVSLQAIERDLPDELVAVMCASHNGEDVHVRAVRRLLRTEGFGVSALRCPPDFPMDDRARSEVRSPQRVRHNCSGKHAGMIVTSARAGWDPARYLERSHPLQRRIAAAVPGATGARRVRIGVDGCGVPVFALPLRAMATLFARLGRPEQLGALEPTAARAVAAMQAQPYLVAGRRRVDTAVMTEAPDVIVKVGAEGLLCAGLLGPGLGVAVKVADGSARAAGPALIHALRQLRAMERGILERLERYERRPILGGGERVGELAPSYRLRWVASKA